MGDETTTSKGGGASLRLPPELVSLILDYTADWELACALGCSNHPNLNPPAPWLEFATPLDRAILRTSSAHSLVPVQYARAHGHTHFTQWGARVMLRFALIDTIDYLFHTDQRQFRQQCEHLLPVVASAWGRRTVLEWAKDSDFKLNPDPRIMAEAIDEASRHGQVQSQSRAPSFSRGWYIRFELTPRPYSARLLAQLGLASPCVPVSRLSADSNPH